MVTGVMGGARGRGRDGVISVVTGVMGGARVERWSYFSGHRGDGRR